MALSYSEMLQTPELAIQILQDALQGKVEAKHNVIGSAITKLKVGLFLLLLLNCNFDLI